ncbi:hypothetical protein [Thalassoroseus pseudoceratinae]|uniref:hypothetical protein n=1 Tax=Thalassoroseus pseudoceratinae TaxID=2713176 RepID=UPI0014233E5A|nr:hypothetical protein [Thalassoroseus pseudoceratinae]
MNYRVKSIGKTCAGTGKPLAPGSVCHSILIDEDGETVRRDFSEEAWEGPPEDALGYWQCKVPESQAKRRPLDTESLFEFFEDLNEDCNHAQEKFRYVVALMLLQKRRLRLEGSSDEDGPVKLELYGSQGEGPFFMKDLQLRPEEIQALEDELTNQIEADED